LGYAAPAKSTWTRREFPDAYLVDLLDESHYQTLTANPAEFSLELQALARQRTVVIDEVQRVPALLNLVHRSIEAERRRFVLLGSSARRLKTSTTNLLAGRATTRTMYPLLPKELGDDFDLERILRFGSVPLIWQADDPEPPHGSLHARTTVHRPRAWHERNISTPR
jgi:predicted AAA+ superfamily ATPase